MKAIEKILNKFGYYKHRQTFTDSEICLMFAEMIGDPSEYTITEKQQREIFDKLSVVEGLNDWLRATIARDLQRYFAAEDDFVRATVKGAIGRTAYLKSLLTKTREVPKESRTKVEGIRYGK